MCEPCSNAREAPLHAFFCPSCIYCGARLIQGIQRLPRPKPEKSERCRQVLQDWVAYGHDEKTIRELVKGPMALEPVPEPEVKKKGKT
jgi:hypothetical protein